MTAREDAIGSFLRAFPIARPTAAKIVDSILALIDERIPEKSAPLTISSDGAEAEALRAAWNIGNRAVDPEAVIVFYQALLNIAQVQTSAADALAEAIEALETEGCAPSEWPSEPKRALKESREGTQRLVALANEMRKGKTE